MPDTTDAPIRSGMARIVVHLYRDLHAELRSILSNVDDKGVNWVPASGANSIATVLVHLLGSEAETLRSVAGMASDRDRDAEFVAETRTVDDLLATLDDAEALLDAVEPLLDDARLALSCALPTLSHEDRRPGAAWLIANYGHAREHLGHVQLTMQLDTVG